MLDYITNTHFKGNILKNLIAFILLFLVSTQSIAAIASWYGPGFYGKRTANGEVYNQNKLTAAHNSLPFGTYVCLTNTENNKTVRVKINDRGGFKKYGRSFDLSKQAAVELGFLKKGTCKVTYKICN